MPELPSLGHLIESLATSIGERLQAAPLQTFIILVTVHLLSIIGSTMVIMRYWPRSDPASANALQSRSCDRTDNPDARHANPGTIPKNKGR
ncbi:hypothetical protein ATEIFO6365_0012037500 [Aspergillus terreus]|uniref:Uncharacterized protein n=1 Tax=Aspergillus terreus TaxID=33178 RepID=A0A5M3ZER4_ASPTE|nr:hypothetical protein ATETN484_0013038600 [Aspergillus terreus]GFF20619.1 hypothetical protein ATEIFO6365_0012037500 [Aspergillus terreus]